MSDTHKKNYVLDANLPRFCSAPRILAPSLLRGLELLDLLDQVGLLIVELLVLGAVRVELGEEVDELVLVAQQDVQYRFRLVRICHEYLQNARQNGELFNNPISSFPS